MIFFVSRSFRSFFLYQRTAFIIPNNCTFFISTKIKWSSPAYFGIRVPSSGRTLNLFFLIWYCVLLEKGTRVQEYFPEADLRFDLIKMCI
jgi:hypothetical protein